MALLLHWHYFLDVCLHILLDGLVGQIADGFLALSTIPALMYTFIERGLLGMNTAVLGARYENQCILAKRIF